LYGAQIYSPAIAQAIRRTHSAVPRRSRGRPVAAGRAIAGAREGLGL